MLSVDESSNSFAINIYDFRCSASGVLAMMSRYFVFNELKMNLVGTSDISHIWFFPGIEVHESQ